MSAPAVPWTLPCPWCTFYIVVFARGARAYDQGSGVEAAGMMKGHVEREHGKTWAEFLAETEPVR